MTILITIGVFILTLVILLKVVKKAQGPLTMRHITHPMHHIYMTREQLDEEIRRIEFTNR